MRLFTTALAVCLLLFATSALAIGGRRNGNGNFNTNTTWTYNTNSTYVIFNPDKEDLYTFTDSQGWKSVFKLMRTEHGNTDVPSGALLYFHGDNRDDFNWTWKQLKEQAKKQNLTAVSILAPYGPKDREQTDRRWYNSPADSSRYANELLEMIESNYGLDRQRVLFTAQSGGASFIGGYYLHLHAQNMEGGALIACPGMELPELKEEKNLRGPDPERFHVRVITTQNDHLRFGRLGEGAKRIFNLFTGRGYRHAHFHDVQVGNYYYVQNGRRYYQYFAGGHCKFDETFYVKVEKLAAEVFGDAKEASPNAMASEFRTIPDLLTDSAG